ncbi:hypothetical protein [Nonomuraea typhae]|uniref:Uncharacterized protein n=1 Tax=Nonomuraea typhae TaxID=2603600 RepID=A0ABW7ZEG6_9ACTN
MIFGHFLLAAAGMLVPVALLGFVMLARWIPVHHDRLARHGGGPSSAAEARDRRLLHATTVTPSGNGMGGVAARAFRKAVRRSR